MIATPSANADQNTPLVTMLVECIKAIDDVASSTNIIYFPGKRGGSQAEDLYVMNRTGEFEFFDLSSCDRTCFLRLKDGSRMQYRKPGNGDLSLSGLFREEGAASNSGSSSPKVYLGSSWAGVDPSALEALILSAIEQVGRLSTRNKKRPHDRKPYRDWSSDETYQAALQSCTPDIATRELNKKVPRFKMFVEAVQAARETIPTTFSSGVENSSGGSANANE